LKTLYQEGGNSVAKVLPQGKPYNGADALTFEQCIQANLGVKATLEMKTQNKTDADGDDDGDFMTVLEHHKLTKTAQKKGFFTASEVKKLFPDFDAEDMVRMDGVKEKGELHGNGFKKGDMVLNCDYCYVVSSVNKDGTAKAGKFTIDRAMGLGAEEDDLMMDSEDGKMTTLTAYEGPLVQFYALEWQRGFTEKDVLKFANLMMGLPWVMRIVHTEVPVLFKEGVKKALRGADESDDDYYKYDDDDDEQFTPDGKCGQTMTIFLDKIFSFGATLEQSVDKEYLEEFVRMNVKDAEKAKVASEWFDLRYDNPFESQDHIQATKMVKIAMGRDWRRGCNFKVPERTLMKEVFGKPDTVGRDQVVSGSDDDDGPDMDINLSDDPDDESE